MYRRCIARARAPTRVSKGKCSSYKALLPGLAVFGVIFGGWLMSAQTGRVNAAASLGTINFQMRLLSNTGAVVADGNYNVEFKVYDLANSTGSSQGSCSGDTHCLWVETRTSGNVVKVVDGYLSVALGGVTAFPSTIKWDQPLWLGVRIGGTGTPSWETIEMTSDGTSTGNKITLTAVPYAFRSSVLALSTASNTATLGFGSITNNPVLTLPNETGTICSTGSVCTGYAPASGSASYIQNGTALQANANFNIQSAAAGSIGGIIRGAAGQTADLFDLQNGSGVAVASFGSTGNTLFQPSTNSTTAFQIQNAAGSNLVQVDSANANITLNGLNTGEINAWQTNANSLPLGRFSAPQIVANGYFYVLGGGNGGNQSTVYYAKLNADGSLGAFGTNTALSQAKEAGGGAYGNGYIYMVGGCNGTCDQTSVLYSKVNADGTLGSWITSANALPAGRTSPSVVIHNGYIYVIGGAISNAATSTVYYAKLNADGSTSAWTTSANPITADPVVAAGAVVLNGIVYIIGGDNGTTAQAAVYYATLNADGSNSTWTAANSLPQARTRMAAVGANGYIYAMGGGNSGAQTTVYYVSVTSSGALGTWQTSANPLPTNARDFLGGAGAIANGYIYVAGGYTGTAALSSVIYSSTSRIKLGGSLDLVGLAGGSQAAGSGGGNLTAGNTQIAGSLQVQGQTAIASSLYVTGNFNTQGSVLFQPATNSTTAFQIQNAAGNNFLQVDTSGANLYLGSGGIASTIQIGNTTGAVAQTINLGNNATASSTTNTNIGSSVAGTTAITGPTTVTNRTSGSADTLVVSNSTSTGYIAKFQNSSTNIFTLASGGAALFQNSTNSTTAFQIQNAAATQLFVIDSTNSRVYVGSTTGDTTGTILVLDTKTTSGDPTGVNGAMYYNSNTNAFRCYLNGFWRDCINTPRTSFYLYNDFPGSPTAPIGSCPQGTIDNGANATDCGTNSAVSATAAVTDTAHPTVLEAQTGTATPPTQAGVFSAGLGNIFRLGNNNVWYFETDVRVPTLSNGTDTFTVYAGFHNDNFSDGSNGCFLKYSDGVNAGKWQGVCLNAGTPSTCDTGITVAANTWYRLDVVVNGAGTNADFYTDGTNRCSVTTNIPTSNNTFWSINILKTVGTTSRNLDMDYVEIRGDLNAAR